MRCTPAVCTKQSWNIRFGAPDTATDANGEVTRYRYDAYGRQTKVIAPDGSSSSTGYLDEGQWQGPDSRRQRIRTELSDGSAGDGVLWQERLLDGLGRVYKTRREGDRSGDIVAETRFADASARPAAESDPHLAGSEPADAPTIRRRSPAHQDHPARRRSHDNRVPARHVPTLPVGRSHSEGMGVGDTRSRRPTEEPPSMTLSAARFVLTS